MMESVEEKPKELSSGVNEGDTGMSAWLKGAEISRSIVTLHNKHNHWKSLAASDNS